MKEQAPTLFIGVGGIGCQIASNISDKIHDDSERDLISFVGIDTNVNDLAKLERHKVIQIQISSTWKVGDYLDNHPDCNSWFPQEQILRQKDMVDGAAQVRPLSRLAFISAEEENKFDPLFNQIQRIRRVNENLHKDVVIVIVGSITGGTGAGMFIQLPFLLRKHFERLGFNNYVIRGMFIGSDITEKVQDFDDNRENVCVNDYSCMKELNAFNIHHISRDNVAGNLVVENYDPTDRDPSNVPYDYLYIYQNSSKNGSVGDVKLPEMIGYVSDVAYSLLFTGINGNSRSIEDNLILAYIRRNALNRFAAAGVCKLVFPTEDAQDYVTYKTISDLVKREWNYLDDTYKNERRVKLELAETDVNVSIPELRTVYVREFMEESKTSGKILSKFNAEAYRKNNTGDLIPKSNDFIEAVENRINKVLNANELTTAAKACQLDKEQMKSFEDAAEEVRRVWEAMGDFASLAETYKDELPITIANEFYPASVADLTLKRAKSTPESQRIDELLSKVHPIVARYFLYSLMNTLKTKTDAYRKALNSLKPLNYLKKDYIESTADVTDDPSSALSDLEDKYANAWRHKQEKVIKKLSDELSDASVTHVATVKQYLKNSVLLLVEDILLDKITQLAENYEGFFKTIDDNITKYEKKMASLEKKQLPWGQIGVYCSKAAFVRMTEEFNVNNKEKLMLSNNTKDAIFVELFTIQATENAKKRIGITETVEEKKSRIESKVKALGSVFETAIYGSIHTSVLENGDGIVNLSIRDALEKEYELDPNSADSVEDYFKKRTNEAYDKAVPMISTTPNAKDQGIKFFAMHSINSDFDDVTSTYNTFVNSVEHPNVNVLIDDDFKSNELVYLRLSYGYVIEDLIKYGPKSKCAEMYEKRISNLNNNTVNIYHTDVEVNPHLNRYWHEEGFVPALFADQRIQDHKDQIAAFIYGLAFDWYRKAQIGNKVDEKNNRILKWEFRINGQTRWVKKCGKYIGTNYADLYDSLLYNGEVKRIILEEAKRRLKRFKGNHTLIALEGLILESEFVTDLAQMPQIENDTNDIYDVMAETEVAVQHVIPEIKREDEQNVYDIFLEMYSQLSKAEWEAIVNGLATIIEDTLKYMFDNNMDCVERKFKEIMKLIYENSKLSKVAENDLNEAQNSLFNLHNEFMTREYELL